MPRTEVYQLRLTKDEKAELARRAKLQNVSIAKLIRQKLSLDSTQPRTWGGKPAARPEPTFEEVAESLKDKGFTLKSLDEPEWKKALPPT